MPTKRMSPPTPVARARGGGVTRAEAELLSQLLSLVSDPVRVRLLFAIGAAEEICVGE